MNSGGVLLGALLLLVAVNGRAAGTSDFGLLGSLFDPGTNAQTGGGQGHSVAVDGDLAIVGAPHEATRDSSGIVRVFHAATGASLLTLTNPTTSHNDYFGSSVAISGMRIVTGAPGTDVGGQRFGRVYVFDLGNATPTVPVATLDNPNPETFQ